MLRQREDMEARLKKIRAKEKAQKVKYLKPEQAYKKRKPDALVTGNDDDSEEQFVLDDYDSDREQSTSVAASGGLSAATLELMEKLGMSVKASREEETEIEDEIKVNHNLRRSWRCLTISDFLLFSDALSAHTIHQ
jgi:chromosome transmission fidelity protein 1